MLCWIASTPLRYSRLDVPREALYSESVRRSLAHHQINGHTDVATAKEWEDRLIHLDKNVLALALVRPSSVYSDTALLSPSERAILDFWGNSVHCNDAMVFCKVLEVMPLQAPMPMHSQSASRALKGMYNEMTEISTQRALHDIGPMHGVLNFPDLMSSWCAKHDLQLDRPVESYRVAMMLPAAYAVLIMERAWDGLAFPFRRKGGALA